MPKTRHSQFEDAFSDFMKNRMIDEYDLKLKTNNTTCRDHSYHLIIPSKIVSYEIRSNNPNVTNETVYEEQQMPPKDEFIDKFDEHFDPYQLTVGSTIMSYVEMTHIVGGNNNEDMLCRIDVYYYKSHLPFPVRLTKMQSLIAKNRKLEEKIETMEETLTSTIHQLDAARHSADSIRRRMRIERRETKEKYVALMEKMRQKLLVYYKDTNEQEDCPVCYETIDASKLKIPACCHYICTSCADRCAPQQCPLCRVEFA